MKTQSNFLHFLRENIHWIAFGAFVILMLILHRFILFTGDDYMHSWVIQRNASGFWDWHVHHYLRGNGRAVIHFLLTLAFALPNAEILRVLDPFVIAFVLLMEAKLCSEDAGKARKAFVFLCFIFLCLFGEFMSMGIYSFTPAFNYIHPLLLTFGVVLCTRRLYSDPPVGKGFCVGYWILCLFAGASMEQTGIMTIGYMILAGLFALMRQNRKPPTAVGVGFAVTFVGYLTVMLAPGNFVRMETSTKPFMENFIAASTMLINTRSFAVFNAIFVLCMAFWLLHQRPANKLLFLFNVCLSLGLLGGCAVNLFLLFNPIGLSLESGGLWGLAWRGYDLLYIFCTVYVPLWIAFFKKDWSYAVHMCIALGSIFILLFASVSPYRPLTPAVLVMMIFMAKTLLEFSENARAGKAAFGVLAVTAALIFAVNLRGYYLNYRADAQNRQLIAQYLSEENAGGELHLHPYADDKAAAYSVCTPGAVFTEADNDTEMYLSLYKMFCGLPQETTLIFDLD